MLQASSPLLQRAGLAVVADGESESSRSIVLRSIAPGIPHIVGFEEHDEGIGGLPSRLAASSVGDAMLTFLCVTDPWCS